MSKTIKPSRKLLDTTAKCSKEGLAYGNCVLESYATISQDKCANEFKLFKQCISKNLGGKKW